MPVHYDIKEDALYQIGTKKGIEKGIEKGRSEEAAKKDYIFVTNLLLNTDFDDAKIASVAAVTLGFVQQVKEERPNFISVSNLLLDKHSGDKKIALLANVSLDFVKKVRFIAGQ
jgi:hypothetical protein